MASISWPAGLPSPLQGGYREVSPDVTMRTKMDMGVDKVRRRCTAAPRKVSVQYRMSLAQADTLETFYRVTSRGGSIAFNWQHPRTGVIVDARFLAPPEIADVDHEASVMCQIEILP